MTLAFTFNVAYFIGFVVSCLELFRRSFGMFLSWLSPKIKYDMKWLVGLVHRNEPGGSVVPVRENRKLRSLLVSL